MSRTLLALIVSLVFSACASAPPEQPQARQPAQPGGAVPTPPSANCSVYVYRNRTSFQTLNPENPFLYVGDEKIGTLAIGQSHCLRLGPGKYSISIREALLFMPSYTSGRLEVEVTAGVPIYVRYSKEFSGVAGAGPTTTATGSSKLQFATEDQWRTRQ